MQPLVAILSAGGLVCGAAIGSFAGVVASRGWRGSLAGRSRCDSCGQTLRWFDLIPLISYVALRRRCRTCGALVRWSVFVWELGGATLGLAIALVVALVTGLSAR